MYKATYKDMKNHTSIIETIEQSPTYKQIMSDSFGGVLYNVANRNKYEGAPAIEALWYGMTAPERNAAGGIMMGAFNFLKGDQ